MKQKTISIVNRNVPFKETYSATGIVLGNYWGGGKGSYATIKFSNHISEEELLTEAEQALLDGSLDSGMGYESLIGARLEITMTRTITLENEDYVNEKSVGHFIGDLTEEEMDFLDECYFNN